MGTIQSQAAPAERIVIMGDHQRLEIEDVVEVRWNPTPPFKVDDLGASLDPAQDTLSWKPNFSAVINEDYKGFYTPLADVVPALGGTEPPAPSIADRVVEMRWLEKMRNAL